MSRTPGSSASGANARSGTDRCASPWYFWLPCHAMPILMWGTFVTCPFASGTQATFPSSSRPHSSIRAGSADRYGTAAGTVSSVV